MSGLGATAQAGAAGKAEPKQLAQAQAQAQDQPQAPLQFDKTVHDFGEVRMSDGELSCSFTLTNASADSLSIYAVISTCGCTNVSWPREAIAPGESGTINATYSNDEGPYPFDKSLTVYTSAQKKPVILHMKGVVKKEGRRK